VITKEAGRSVAVPAQIILSVDDDDTPTCMRYLFFDGDVRVCDFANGTTTCADVARMLHRKVRETGEVHPW
jgi:hypothetical protein